MRTKAQFLHGARFDNLFSTYCAIESLIESCREPDSLDSSSTVRTIACWDNEEIGSVSAHGAESNLLEAVLHRLVALGYDGQASTASSPHSVLHTAIANSFLLSSDMVRPSVSRLGRQSAKKARRDMLFILRSPKSMRSTTDLR